MNRNTWIIIAAGLVVILGLIWIFNTGIARPMVSLCVSSMEQNGQTYCTKTIRGYPMTSSEEPK